MTQSHHTPLSWLENLKGKFLHQLSLMTKNPTMKYEHVIQWIWKGENSSRVSFYLIFHVFAFVHQRDPNSMDVCLEWKAFFSLDVSKNSNKQGKHKDWGNIRENDRAIYQQPVSTCIFFTSVFFFLRFFWFRFTLLEIKMKNRGEKTHEYLRVHGNSSRLPHK